jgi:hypothetical protein
MTMFQGSSSAMRLIGDRRQIRAHLRPAHTGARLRRLRPGLTRRPAVSVRKDAASNVRSNT